MNDALQILLDRKEIEDLFARYAEALDAKNWDALRDIFTEDATTEWFSNPEWIQHGIDDIIRWILSWVGSEEMPTHHILGNHLCEIDGDTAKASCRVCAYHQGGGERAGLYQESLAYFWAELVRTPGGWKFKRFGEELNVFKGTNFAFDRSVYPYEDSTE